MSGLDSAGVATPVAVERPAVAERPAETRVARSSHVATAWSVHCRAAGDGRLQYSFIWNI